MSAPGRTAASLNAAPDGGARQVRQRQVLLFSALAAAALLGVAAWIAGSGGTAPAPAPRIAAELAGPGTAEESWTRRSETRIGRIEADLEAMQDENRRLADDNRRLQDRLRSQADEAKGVIDTLTAALGEAERARGADDPPPEVPAPGSVFAPANPGAVPSGGDAAAPPPEAPLIRRFDLEAPVFGDPGTEAAKPLSLWLPAGAHAQAVVIAGVDASAGVASQGDPRPVLLRITGPGWTAADGGGAALPVDLDGCTVTAAAHGDLSSEKVYARLRTLTCAGGEPGTVVETPVAGFVAGSGKVGVRGPVVSREGALVEKAFLAGLVSGLGEGVSGAFAPQAVATGGGAAVANTGLGDIGRAGLGSGAASAGGKVADYMIRRAEQYQPVIQLQAGTAVTVVFLEGTRLDGRPDTEPPRRRNEND